jgi:hypothetical protein
MYLLLQIMVLEIIQLILQRTLPDANYCANLSVAETSGGAAAVSGIYATSAAPTSSAIRVLCVGNASDSLADTAFYNVAIFR